RCRTESPASSRSVIPTAKFASTGAHGLKRSPAWQPCTRRSGLTRGHQTDRSPEARRAVARVPAAQPGLILPQQPKQGKAPPWLYTISTLQLRVTPDEWTRRLDSAWIATKRE